MRNERTINNPNEPEALTCEDYLIRLFPIFNTALFTSINTAAASIGYALTSHINRKIAPSSESDVVKNAAISTVIGFMIISLACAYFSTPSTKKNPRDRLSETANLFYPLACTDMILAFPLPLFTAYFFYNASLYDAAMIGLSAGLGANLMLLPILAAAMLFQLGNRLKSTETAPNDQAFEDRVPAIVHWGLNAEPRMDPLNHTVIQMKNADPTPSALSADAVGMRP